MAADELKPGDVVELRSGGPDMTVAWVDVEEGILAARCVWFDKSEKIEGTVFPVTALRKLK